MGIIVNQRPLNGLIQKYESLPWHHVVWPTFRTARSEPEAVAAMTCVLRQLQGGRVQKPAWWMFTVEKGPKYGRVHCNLLLGGTAQWNVDEIRRLFYNECGYTQARVFASGGGAVAYALKEVADGAATLHADKHIERKVRQWQQTISN